MEVATFLLDPAAHIGLPDAHAAARPTGGNLEGALFTCAAIPDWAVWKERATSEYEKLELGGRMSAMSRSMAMAGRRDCETREVREEERPFELGPLSFEPGCTRRWLEIVEPSQTSDRKAGTIWRRPGVGDGETDGDARSAVGARAMPPMTRRLRLEDEDGEFTGSVMTSSGSVITGAASFMDRRHGLMLPFAAMGFSGNGTAMVTAALGNDFSCFVTS